MREKSERHYTRDQIRLLAKADVVNQEVLQVIIQQLLQELEAK